MIRKELEKIKIADRKDEAGYRTEEQLAFYLRRHFENDSAIYVYNGLRLKVGTDVAQPDFLILHSNGLVIIESKSCTTAIKVNEHGDWYRVFHGENVPIPSPIKQAERQGKFLVNLLGKHQNNILENHQRNIRTQYIVSYSDDADIGGIPAGFRHRVCKADQVPDRIKTIIAQQQAQCVNNGGGLTSTEIDRIDKLLFATHVSSPFAIKEKNPIPVTDTTVENRGNTINATCRHCGSHYATILKGRYGFYSKCVDCSRTTSLHPVCHYCKCDCDVKSSKGYHYAVCPECNWARGYLTKPTHADSMCGQAIPVPFTRLPNVQQSQRNSSRPKTSQEKMNAGCIFLAMIIFGIYLFLSVMNTMVNTIMHR